MTPPNWLDGDYYIFKNREYTVKINYSGNMKKRENLSASMISDFRRYHGKS